MRPTVNDADWKCDLCGRKQAGGTKPPQGWMSLNITDRFTGAADERVLCGYCVEVVRADHLAKQDTDKLAERIAEYAVAATHVYGMMSSDPEYLQRLKEREEAKKQEMMPHIAAILAPFLARNAAMEAVLRECRPFVKYVGSVTESDDLEADAESLLSRIDELTAKGAGQ